MLNPKPFFGLVLRAMGAWWIGDAAVNLADMVFKLDGVPTGSHFTWQDMLMFGAANALVGLIMFLGADDIVRFAYREHHQDEVERF